MTILELAGELGKTLSESPEFIRMKQADEARKENAAAMNVMEDFSKRRDVIMQRAQKEDISKEEMMALRNEMQAESDKLTNNPVISEYIEAMQQFDELMRQVNQTIGSYIAPENAGGCGGGCSSCSGCA